MDEQLVLVVDHQPQHWSLELIESWLAGSIYPHVGRAPVEAVKRIVDLRIDPGGGTCISPDVNNPQSLHNASLIS
jgi:hypothetical protein